MLEISFDIKQTLPFRHETIEAAEDIANQLQFDGMVYVFFHSNRKSIQTTIMKPIDFWVKAITINYNIHILYYCQDFYESMEQFERIFLHEITHAIVNSLTNSRVPTWLNEGLAMVLSKEPVPQELKEFLSDNNNFYYYEKCYFRTQELLKDFSIRQVLSKYIKEENKI